MFYFISFQTDLVKLLPPCAVKASVSCKGRFNKENVANYKDKEKYRKGIVFFFNLFNL